MLDWLLASLAAVGSSDGDAPNQCAAYVGQPISATPFEDVYSRLPQVAPRGPYESARDYEARLAQAAGADQAPLVMRITPVRRDEGLSYDPDRQRLIVYVWAFGGGRVNFTNAGLGLGRPREDNSVSAIGFQIAAVETSFETYQATNGFGAPVTVRRTHRRVAAVWERIGRLGENPFLGTRDLSRVAELQMPPGAAQDLIERGGTALLFTPRPPFRAVGESVLEPRFDSPTERRDALQIIIADVQCGFLLDGSGRVTHAFQVR